LYEDVFYALVLDLSRVDPDPVLYYTFNDIVYERDWRIYVLFLVEFFIVFFGSMAACCLDSIDFSKTELLLSQGEEDLISQVAMVKKLPF